MDFESYFRGRTDKFQYVIGVGEERNGEFRNSSEVSALGKFMRPCLFKGPSRMGLWRKMTVHM